MSFFPSLYHLFLLRVWNQNECLQIVTYYLKHYFVIVVIYITTILSHMICIDYFLYILHFVLNLKPQMTINTPIFYSLSVSLHFFTRALFFSVSSGFCTGLTRSEDFSGQVSPDCTTFPSCLFILCSFWCRRDFTQVVLRPKTFRARFPQTALLSRFASLFLSFLSYFPPLLLHRPCYFYVGSVLQYFLISLFAFPIVSACVIIFGALFHSLVASPTNVVLALLVLPVSMAFPLVAPLVSIWFSFHP